MGFMQDDGKSEPDYSVSENEQFIALFMTHLAPEFVFALVDKNYNIVITCILCFLYFLGIVV